LNLPAIGASDAGNRKDPVQDRVAIPAADPPDNIMHDHPPVRVDPACRRAFVDFP